MNLNNLWLSRKTAMIPMILLLLLVAMMGMRGLNADSIWVDEYWSLYDAGGAMMGPLSPAGVWERVAEKDPWQSPGYYLLLNQWGKGVGWSEFAARSLSLFSGILAVAWIYRLGRDLISRFGGIAAAIALGVSAYYIYFLHEMRGYTLYVLFTPWMVWAYWRLLKKGGSGTYFLLFVAITGALYTHYFAALTAVILGVLHVTAGVYLLRQDRRRWWSISAVFLTSAVTFSPWLAVLMGGIARAISESDARRVTGLSTERMIVGLLFLFSNGSTALLVFLLFYGFRLSWRQAFVWFWFLSVLLLLIVINAFLGVILEVRYMFALWPALAILVGFGLDRLRNFQPSLPVAVLGIWIAGGIWVSVSAEAAVALSNPHWHLPWREFRQVVQPRAEPGDAAIFVLPDWTWAVYHKDDMGYYLNDLPLKLSLLEQPGHFGAEQFRQMEEAAVQNVTRVWTASTAAQPLTYFDQFEAILTDQNFLHCARPSETDLLHVDLYARISAAQENDVLVFADPGEIRLIPFQAVPTKTTPGILGLTFLWNIADPAQAQFYSIAFHLHDIQGNLVAQSDQGIPPESLACRLYELDTHAALSGDYILYATLYRWDNGDRLPLDGGNYEVASDGRIVLGRLHIDRND